MRREQNKKWAAVTMAAVMAAGTLTGCGGTATEGNQEQPAASASVGTVQSDSGEERQTLTVGVSQNSNVEDYESNYLTQLIEQECNVNLEFVYLPSAVDDAKSKFAIMASSNTKLPDVLAVSNSNFTDLEIADYGSKGVFIPLNDYLANPENAVYFSQIAQEEREKMLAAATSPDGNVYCLVQNTPEDWNMTPFRFWINRTWLDALNLDTPATTEEFYNVMKEFVTKDPNGNGVADEIGITGCTDGWGCNSVYYLMNSFVFYNGNQSNGGLALDESGSLVTAPFASDGWREGLEYMNMLCNEGILSPAMFTQDATQFTGVLSNTPQITGSCAAGGFGYWSGAQENENFQDMELLAPLTGPDGLAYAAYNEYTPTPAWLITKDCENPELAFKVGDFFYRNDVSLTVRYGEEDVDWTTDEAVCRGYKGLYEELWDIPCSLVQMNMVWSTVQNKHWYNVGPRYTSLDSYRGINSDQKVGEEGVDYTSLTRQQSAEYYMNAHPDKVLSTLKYTKEEAQSIAEIQENVLTYVKQSMAEFITGNRSLSEWDNYLKELDSMGLQDWLTVAQTAYERGQN